MGSTKPTKYFIRECADRPMNKREFLKHQKNVMVGDCVLRAQLLDRRTFTVSQINELIREKIIKPVRYRSQVYFRKDELLEAIKYFAEQPKLFNGI